MIGERPSPVVLTIAGSDSGGAAGIQADLKTIVAFGLHGTSAISAVTAQNLRKVTSIHHVPSRELARQIHAVFDGFDIAAVKIGMLGSAANVLAVADVLRRVRARNVVLDPVLVSSSGTALLSTRGLAVLRNKLIPLATVLTPNLPEAGALLGYRVSEAQMKSAAERLLSLGPGAVLLKGGHGRRDVVRDVLAGPDWLCEFRHRRLAVRARGTGCVLSTAIACGLAQGESLPISIETAQKFLQQALRHAARQNSRGIHILHPARLRET